MSAITAERLAEIKASAIKLATTGDVDRNLGVEEILELVAGVERLQAEIKENEAQYKIVINGETPGDEAHCTCVPILRAEVERLQVENEQFQVALAECRKIAVSWLTCVDKGWDDIEDIRDVADSALEAEQ